MFDGHTRLHDTPLHRRSKFTAGETTSRKREFPVLRPKPEIRQSLLADIFRDCLLCDCSPGCNFWCLCNLCRSCLLRPRIAQIYSICEISVVHYSAAPPIYSYSVGGPASRQWLSNSNLPHGWAQSDTSSAIHQPSAIGVRMFWFSQSLNVKR